MVHNPDRLFQFFIAQHPPLYTYGKRGNDKDLVTSRQELERMGIAIHQTSRGGEVRRMVARPRPALVRAG